MSTRHPHLPANEKAQTEGLSCLKMADFRAALMVFRPSRPMRPGERPVVEEISKLISIVTLYIVIVTLLVLLVFSKIKIEIKNIHNNAS